MMRTSVNVCAWRLIWLSLLALLVSVPAMAQDANLRAGVDRDSIRANESFTYILRGEGQLSGRPDLSVLAQDFDVLNTSQSTRIQIVGNRTTQVAEWLVELMPRAPGSFELPAITLGRLRSNPVAVEVLPPIDDTAAGDIFIDVELDRPTTYVQAQAIYTLRLFVGIGTGRATLTAPRVDGGEAIVEKLGADREYQTVRGGRVYNVRERKYAIFPQSVGSLTIGPAVYDAVIFPSAGFQRQQRLSSNVVELEVRPAVAPPPAYPGAVWLPATALEIEDRFADGGELFEQGVPRTRVLTVVASGVLETQLPELRPPAAAGIRQYPDQPELEREVTDAGLRASRTERYAVIAQQAGEVELPAIELPWWNVATGNWEVARVEPRRADVLPALDAGPAPGPGSVVPPGPAVTEDGGGAGWWPWLSAALALGWLLTAAAWLRSTRPAASREPRAAAVRRPTERGLFRQIAAACRVNDARRTQELLLDWGRLRFGEPPPASLGALASRVGGALAEEIAALEAALYGSQAGEWRGERLLERLKAARAVARRAVGDDQDPLVPLYR